MTECTRNEASVDVQEAQVHIGVVGLGTVGRAVRELFTRPGIEVVAWDASDPEPYPAAGFAACDFAVVCVDTPFVNGHADLSRVEEALRRLPAKFIVIKSTVPPGTTTRLAGELGKDVCYWPEYISESKYHNPYFPQRVSEVPFVVLGGEPLARAQLIDWLMPVLGPTKTYFQCSATEAELIKYAENTFFATKITFANEFRRLSDTFGADWHTVREGWLLDPRVGRMHTAALADDPGFGGKCLPKDLATIVAAARDAQYRCVLLEAVQAANELFRAPHASDDEARD